MVDLTHFSFVSAGELPYFQGDLVCRIPSGVSNKSALLQHIATSLSFPSYFGHNWNALYDCLRDFHWIDKRRIVIVHEDLPRIPPAELSVYLAVLKDAVADWGDVEPHELIVVFDISNKADVIAAL